MESYNFMKVIHKSLASEEIIVFVFNSIAKLNSN